MGYTHSKNVHPSNPFPIPTPLHTPRHSHTTKPNTMSTAPPHPAGGQPSLASSGQPDTIGARLDDARTRAAGPSTVTGSLHGTPIRDAPPGLRQRTGEFRRGEVTTPTAEDARRSKTGPDDTAGAPPAASQAAVSPEASPLRTDLSPSREAELREWTRSLKPRTRRTNAAPGNVTPPAPGHSSLTPPHRGPPGFRRFVSPSPTDKHAFNEASTLKPKSRFAWIGDKNKEQIFVALANYKAAKDRKDPELDSMRDDIVKLADSLNAGKREWTDNLELTINGTNHQELLKHVWPVIAKFDATRRLVSSHEVAPQASWSLAAIPLVLVFSVGCYFVTRCLRKRRRQLARPLLPSYTQDFDKYPEMSWR